MSDLPEGIQVQHTLYGDPKTDVMESHTYGDVKPIVDGWLPPDDEAEGFGPRNEPETKRVPKRNER